MDSKQTIMESGCSAPVSEWTKDFTGRHWVFCVLDDWLAKGEPQVFLLSGRPGSGKTALAARLVEMSRGEVPTEAHPHLANYLAYAHFCRITEERSLNPLCFVEALSLQLARRYSAFARALAEIDDPTISINFIPQLGSDGHGSKEASVFIESLHVSHHYARLAFDRLVREPLSQLCTPNFNEPLIILVDALDEALAYHQEESIVTLLCDATQGLPYQVRWLLTSRPDPQVLATFGKPALDLEDDALDKTTDLRAYIEHRLQSRPDQQCVNIVENVVIASDGYFHLARSILDRLLTHEISGVDPSLLVTITMDSLQGFYSNTLGHLRLPFEDYQPLLGVLAVAQEPLTEEHLAHFTGKHRSDIRLALDNLRQLLFVDDSLPPAERTYAIFHKSFADFLLDQEQSRKYWCEEHKQHKYIVDYYLSRLP